MKLPTALLLGAAAICVALVANPSSASAQQGLTENGAWTAYTLSENGRKVCYMVSRPKKEEGNYSRRGEAFAMVTRRQGSPTVEDVSVTSGYPYKEGTAAKVNVDGTIFKFGLMQNEFAWADEPDRNPAIVKAMIKGLKLTVRGTSRKDTYSLDTYSLKGFTATHKAIKKACP